jgi:hypothetical protein
MSGGYSTSLNTVRPKRLPRITSSKQVTRTSLYLKERHMKLTLKERIRNWLGLDPDEYGDSISINREGPNIQSNGFRLNIYSASGGTIVETTKYDRKNDEDRNSLHVITEDKDLGQELAKIITIESLR